jgi:dimethylargininase
MRVFDFNSAIVRRPGRSVIDGLRANAGPAPVYETVVAEQLGYIEALQSAGMRVTALPPLEQFPDSIFVEDPALVFTDVAMLLRPGAPTRRDEARELAAELGARFETVLKLGEGFADGGDILVTPGRIYIGLSARTNVEGAAALKLMLNAVDLVGEVVHVPAGTLHLKTDCALIDEETILASHELANSGLFGNFRVLEVPAEERHACNAIRVNEVVFIRSGCPRTYELLARRGLNVVALPVAEIAKIDAGLSCMSLRWFDRAAT